MNKHSDRTQSDIFQTSISYLPTTQWKNKQMKHFIWLGPRSYWRGFAQLTVQFALHFSTIVSYKHTWSQSSDIKYKKYKAPDSYIMIGPSVSIFCQICRCSLCCTWLTLARIDNFSLNFILIYSFPSPLPSAQKDIYQPCDQTWPWLYTAPAWPVSVLVNPTAWGQTRPCLYTAPDLFQSLYHPNACDQTWPCLYTAPDLFQSWLTPLLEVKHDPVFIQPLTCFILVNPTAWGQTWPCLYTAPDLFQSLHHPLPVIKHDPVFIQPLTCFSPCTTHYLWSNMTLSLYSPWPVSVLAPPHFLAQCERWQCRPSRWFCTDPLHTATILCVQCRQTSCHTQEQLNKICKISIIFSNIPSLIKRKNACKCVCAFPLPHNTA